MRNSTDIWHGSCFYYEIWQFLVELDVFELFETVLFYYFQKSLIFVFDTC